MVMVRLVDGAGADVGGEIRYVYDADDADDADGYATGDVDVECAHVVDDNDGNA